MTGKSVTGESGTGADNSAPLFSVVKGHPTDEELAAVLAVLSASSGSAAPAPKPAAPGWAAYWRASRTPLVPGPGAWSASARR